MLRCLRSIPIESFLGALLLAALSAAEGRAGTDLVTTTTTYLHNADSALTAVTTQVDDQPPSTRYLRYDNFLPNTADPTTGTVSIGNGRVIGYGGDLSGGLEAAFEFDRRDRLVGYSGSGGTTTYDHRADGMMSSATAGVSGPWHFFYDASQHPRMTNVYEDPTGLWSGRMGSGRYLSDGSEELLMQPRKDVACLYEPETQSVTPYRYDSYGARSDTETSSYDLRENPHQYAHEFRDPVWGGYYLRARWYHPDLPTFLSRDTEPDAVNHYGYAGGNPEMNVDPSGRSYKSFKRGFARFDKSAAGHVMRTVFAPFYAPVALSANAGAFWHQFTHPLNNPTDLFLVAGVVAEAFGPVGAEVSPVFFGARSLATRFATRAVTDAVLGLGQSAIQAGILHGVGNFHWVPFLDGAEYTVGGFAWMRLVGGVGYQPYNLRAERLTDFVNQTPISNTEAFIFRERVRGGPSLVYGDQAPISAGKQYSFSNTTPWQERYHIGLYHERVVAITRDGDVCINDFNKGWVQRQTSWDEYLQEIKRSKSRLSYVGKKSNFDSYTFRSLNPRKFLTPQAFEMYKTEIKNNEDIGIEYRKYDTFKNNCQHHSAAVIQGLGM